MAVDVGIADLVGSLFFPAVAEAGGAAAADVGLGAAADIGAGLGAAELGAGGAGLAGEIAAGTAPEVLASAAPAIAAGDISGQIAAEGGLAGLGAAADAALPLGVDIASNAALGDTVGLPASQALDFQPTAADFAGSEAQFGVGSAAPGTHAALLSSAAPSASAATVASPAQALAFGDPNIAANLGSDVPLPADLGGETQLPSVTSDAAAALASATPAGAPAAAAPVAAGGGSILGTLGGIASNPLAQMAVPGGFLAYNLLKGPPGIPSDAQAALNNAGSTLPGLEAAATKNTPLLQNTASTDLNLANNFQVSPAQSAALETWKQNQYNQLRQQIANQNRGNSENIESSSEWVQGKNQIDQQALAQQTEMINQLITTAFQAQTSAEQSISSASTINDQMNRLLMQAAQLQVTQDQSFNQAVGSAMQAFGLIAGLNAGKFAKTPAATNPLS